MNKEYVQQLTLALLVVGLVGVGGMLFKQNSRIVRLSRSMEALTLQVEGFIHEQSDTGEFQSDTTIPGASQKAEASSEDAVSGFLVFQGQTDAESHRPSTIRLTDMDGALMKDMALPQNFVAGGDHLKVVAGHIYYLAGSPSLTSIGRIDLNTGTSKVFSFTKTVNTNVGNVLSSIIAWAVSQDGHRLAWMDPDGVVTVAMEDGSGVKSYRLASQHKPIRGLLAFEDADTLLMWRQTAPYAFQRVDLKTDAVKTLFSDQANLDLTLSPTARKLAYVSDKGDVHVVDLATSVDLVIASVGAYDRVSGFAFSLDESKLFLSFDSIGGQGPSEVDQVDLVTKAKKVVSRTEMSVADVVRDGVVLVRKDDGTYTLPLSSGEASQKISDFWYLGSSGSR